MVSLLVYAAIIVLAPVVSWDIINENGIVRQRICIKSVFYFIVWFNWSS